MKHFKKLALAGAMTLAGLGAQAQETLKMATIAPGTSAYLTMTTFASLVNQNQDDYNITVDSTGAGSKHLIELARGKLDFALGAPTLQFFLKHKKAMYKKLDNHKELAEQLRLVMWFPYGQYHVVTYADSGIKTLADLKGKRVFLGPPGGGAWNAAYSWVKVTTGLDVKNGDYENVKASWSSALQGFQDRQYDVYISGGIAPYPLIEQLSLTNKIRLLGMDKETWEGNEAAHKYLKGLPGRAIGIIEKGVYGDGVLMDHDIYTNSATVGIATRVGVPEDTIYKVTKAFWENAAAMRGNTPWMNHITMDYAVKEGGLPLHLGAQRFYKEANIEIPAGSMAK